MRLSFTFFFLIVFFNVAWAQGPGALERVKLSRALQFDLPVNMRPMSETEINGKYLSSKQPLAMYTTQDGLVDFGIKLSNASFLDRDLNLAAEFYRSNLLNLYDSVTFIREEIETINKRLFVVFEFTSVVYPEKNETTQVFDAGKTKPKVMYTYIQYGVVNGKLAVFNFSCPSLYRTTWQATAWDIMHSVKMKKTL